MQLGGLFPFSLLFYSMLFTNYDIYPTTVILILLFVQQVFGGSTWRPPASVQTPLQKAQALVANMTQDEKINLVHGYSSLSYLILFLPSRDLCTPFHVPHRYPIRYANGYYAGNIPSNSRLRIPSLQLQDGPQV